MNDIQGADRGQEQLSPGRVEDYVAAGAAVRVLDAFVEPLDLAAPGRPA
jgi:transposase